MPHRTPNYNHHPDREETIFAYLDLLELSLRERFEELHNGLNWKWRALIATANIYIEANRQAFKLATKSAKGVSSILSFASTYVLTNL